jgi:2'-5' RNA ligase
MKQLNSHDFQEVYNQMGISLDTLGCVMLDLEKIDTMISRDFEQGIFDYKLYFTKNPDRKWIKGWVSGEVPHITLLYGLLDNAHNWEKPINTVLADWKMDTVEIDHIDYFDSPYSDEEYYCVIAHIKVTPELMEGHQRLEFLPHINTFTGYKPHMTVCYIKKDEKMRDELIAELNKELAGKSLKVKQGINLGYKTKEKTVVKVGQVWRNKLEERKFDRVCVIGVSPDQSLCFLSVVWEHVDPQWKTSYLIENYILDESYQ